MCGILGYYKSSGLRKEDILQAQMALGTMNHRGPNGEGICLIDSGSGKSWTYFTHGTPADIVTDTDASRYVDDSADILLAHKRLSILDLSSKGYQPMRDAKGNLIVHNGEVYNFVELRDQLSARGHRFSTGTDTEVILAAYRQWGTDCFHMFNGMWAVIIWDAIRQRVIISNDRIGVKQLYVWGGAGEWMMASEIKAIRTLPHGPKLLHNETVDHFLRDGQIDLTEQTALRDVLRFQAGHFLRARPQEVARTRAQPYWDFPATGIRKVSLDDAAHELRELLDSAISLRMRSDVPWGTTLSGGLDSSTIVYLAHRIRLRRKEEGPIHTFTSAFPGKEGDESPFVRFIEGDLGLHAHYVNPLEQFGFEDFERFMYHQDQPVASTSMYAQWSVMKAVGQSEVVVLLDGQGGDELFGGYHHHFYKYARSLYLAGKFSACNQLVEAYCAIKGWNEKEVKKTVRNDVKLFIKLKLGGRMPGPAQVTAWNAAGTLSDILKLDLRSCILPSLLRYEDRNSMAFGIEARLPFLDYRIVEFALTLPDEYKIRDGWQKFILRKAMGDLPEKIRLRKDKKGFTTPHEEWIREHRIQFETYAQAARDAGADRVWLQKKTSQLDSAALFRLASLGAWFGKG
jgi:asparagine synthase (glutamine-hydrolysing)